MSDRRVCRLVTRREIMKSLGIMRTHPELSHFSQEVQEKAQQMYERLISKGKIRTFLGSRTHDEILLTLNPQTDVPSTTCCALKIAESCRKSGYNDICLHAFAPQQGNAHTNHLLRCLVVDIMNALAHLYTGRGQMEKAYPESYLGGSREKLVEIFMELYSMLLMLGWTGTMFIFIHGLEYYYEDNYGEAMYLMSLLDEMKRFLRDVPGHVGADKHYVKVLYTACLPQCEWLLEEELKEKKRSIRTVERWLEKTENL